MHRLIGGTGRPLGVFLTVILVVVSLQILVASPSHAEGGGGCNVIINPSCTVGAGGGGTSGGGTHGGDGGGSTTDPCSKYPDAAYGSKPPAVSQACADELQGRYCNAMLADMLGGMKWPEAGRLTFAQIGVVNQNLYQIGCPTIVTPATLAEQAYKSIVFSRPSGSRSPSQTLLYKGFSFTYVNLWTYYWTAANTWTPLTATASAAGLTATVTAKPTELIYDPGDGSAAVACDGPGRAWTNADGNDLPTDGACAYQYTKVTSSPITSTQSILWKITWTGTGGAAGEIPQLTTSTSGQLNVMQIQTVVTR